MSRALLIGLCLLIYLPACSGPKANYRTLRDTGITTAMDITTDALVVSIPIILLWRVSINLRQKIGLGILLCLSLVMAIIAIARMSGINLKSGVVDIVWLAFWQQQESSIAVIMISISAFRSLFVARVSNRPSPKDFSRPRYRNRLYLKLTGQDKDTRFGLPQIPGATLTGMRSVIRDGGQSENLVSRPQEAWVPRKTRSLQEADAISKEPETILPDNGNVMEGRDMV